MSTKLTNCTILWGGQIFIVDKKILFRLRYNLIFLLLAVGDKLRDQPGQGWDFRVRQHGYFFMDGIAVVSRINDPEMLKPKIMQSTAH